MRSHAFSGECGVVVDLSLGPPLWFIVEILDDAGATVALVDAVPEDVAVIGRAM